MTNDHTELEQFILGYWDNLKITDTLETKKALGLPKPYYAPSMEAVDGFRFEYMFYWDSYFIAQGFWGTEREKDIFDMLQNMFDLVNRFGMVPNANSFAFISRSQPPLLSSLARQAAERLNPDHNWLHLAYERIREEYGTAWMGEVHPHIRKVHKGLSRYFDANFIDSLAEAESGWDFTSRFDNNCLSYLPIDLNSLLFKVEQDLAYFADRLGKEDEKQQWLDRAEKRRKTVNELMWDEDEGMFFDYDFRAEKKGESKSLAAYTAMFTGLATKEQAEKLVENLPRFETEYGLACTDLSDEPTYNKQWTSPNGWAPLIDIVVDGLLAYGYTAKAEEVAQNWVNSVDRTLKKTGKIYEKYNMLNVEAEAESAHYPDQYGFGWTNGVTFKLIQLLKK